MFPFIPCTLLYIHCSDLTCNSQFVISNVLFSILIWLLWAGMFAYMLIFTWVHYPTIHAPSLTSFQFVFFQIVYIAGSWSHSA